jgi:hypothetical protein
MYDEIDINLLEKVDRISGAQVSEVLVLARGSRSETQLRTRLNELDIQGAILLDRRKEKGKVFAIITPHGREVLAEGRNRCPLGGEQHD